MEYEWHHDKISVCNLRLYFWGVDVLEFFAIKSSDDETEHTSARTQTRKKVEKRNRKRKVKERTNQPHRMPTKKTLYIIMTTCIRIYLSSH